MEERRKGMTADVKRTKAVQALGEVIEAEQPMAGGKGGTLARLYQAGYPVPDGFVILPAAFAGEELTPEAWAQVEKHLARLRGGDPQAAFAVRSSSLAEDSTRASFAGEFETVLGVCSDEAVRTAIDTVRRSRNGERVQAYRQARDLETAQPEGTNESVSHEMAVVVQRLVPAELAGVLFTADPVSGSRKQMVGNYAHGRGDKLVSGEVQHLEFTLSRPKGRYEGPAKLKRFGQRLFKMAQRLEGELDGPQDIEWAVAKRKIHLLQSRPITTLQGFDPITGEYNATLTGDYVWSSVNVGEAVSAVMTPLTWSVMHGGFSELDLLPGHPSIGNIGGRLYQNTTVMISVIAALGKDFRQLAREMGGVREEYLASMDQYMVPLPDASLWAILPNALKARRKEKQALKNMAAYAQENRIWCQAMRQRVEAAETLIELAALMEGEIWPRGRASFWRTYAGALQYSVQVGPLRRDLTKKVGEADADALLSNVSRRDELLASLGPVVGLARVARGEMQREAYLEQWGHRSTDEAEMSIPRPAENPDWLDRQLAAYARTPVDVDGLLARQGVEFEAAWSRFEGRHPRQVRSMRRRLERAAEAARQRETARSEATRLLWVVRAWVLRVGELTGLVDGAFFLELEELLDLLDGRGAPTENIPARRQTYERYKVLPPLPMLIRGRFDPFQWAADPERNSIVFDSHGLLPKLTLEAPRENVLLGAPGSAGRVEGLVRRLDCPEEGDALQPGEILVTTQTNIGWTLLFPRLGAIVTEVGAPLSHAAIVARELGIPAVVNCDQATRRLRTGDRVRVDGVQGIVEILDECQPDLP
jgi:phosphohistidine swiveling domain-containing protein